MDELTRLALDARDGDMLAFGAFVRRSQGEVWRFVAALSSRAEADDVTQDVYLRAWRALPAFRGESTARTWLLSIARRASVDALRRRARGRRLQRQAEDAARTAPSTVADGAGSGALEALVRALTPRRRAAFVLTQLLGCSYEEAAEVCAVPVGTIRSRVARARADLVAAVHAAEATG
jgi:RNA polymerase sigma-70 factor (ECF subfamily)